MAQQTINVGTAPNDGTGTPLRTAFQYTNSNFSELYTAVGPSGNNIVVPGSATITGDLTVDTSTLKVDSANDRVGIGTASPAVLFHVALPVATFGEVGRFYDSSGNGISFTANASSGFNQITSTGAQPLIVNVNSSERYRIASDGVATWSNVGGVAGTAMTLNATGLGVGGSPTTGVKLHVGGGNAHIRNAAGGQTKLIFGPSANYVEMSGIIYDDADGSVTFGTIQNYATKFITNNTERLRIDTSGNVGIGITPSAWSGTKALQIGSGSAVSDVAGDFHATANAYNTTTGWVYISNAAATDYYQRLGAHVWRTVGAGTGAITWTQAMTLDASGNLLVGKTATNYLTVGCELKPNGAFQSTQSGSTNANTCWDTYSTGAGAYRFYVGMAGTVFATNTTISAISDARFKENVQDIDVGLGAILALKPRKFDWKEGKGKNIKGDRGFIAQEFETVFPNLIDEWKENAPEGEAPYKSVRQDLIPVLVKAIQELAAEVNALKNA